MFSIAVREAPTAGSYEVERVDCETYWLAIRCRGKNDKICRKCSGVPYADDRG